jgi:hypothetical protein
MSATVSRTNQASPDMRQVTIALGALTLAVAMLVGVTVVRQSSGQADAAPLAVTAPVVHDRGWSSAGSEPAVLKIRGTSGGSLTYTGIPYAAPGELTVNGTGGGSLNYTGIPSAAPGSGTTGGGNGTRLAQ